MQIFTISKLNWSVFGKTQIEDQELNYPKRHWKVTSVCYSNFPFLKSEENCMYFLDTAVFVVVFYCLFLANQWKGWEERCLFCFVFVFFSEQINLDQDIFVDESKNFFLLINKLTVSQSHVIKSLCMTFFFSCMSFYFEV